jgi:hypothetical protein
VEQAWWRLPGPSRFLDRVLHELREGRGVVLALPEHHPDGLRAALYERAQAIDWWYWKVVDLAEGDGGESPARLLHRLCAPADPGRLLDASTLAGCEDFRRLLLWVEGVTAVTWPAWRDFLEQYARACRPVPVAERALVCVPTVGLPTACPPNEDEALAYLSWRGAVGRLDMTLYLAQLLADRRLPPLHRGVALAVGAEIAGTDPQLAQGLASLEVSDLVQPTPLLWDLAQCRGWSPREAASPRWSAGMVDELDGAEYVHSAALVAAGRQEDLRRRVWRAEVGVLFPFIEEQRLRLLEAREVRRHLRLPLSRPAIIIAQGLLQPEVPRVNAGCAQGFAIGQTG